MLDYLEERHRSPRDRTYFEGLSLTSARDLGVQRSQSLAEYGHERLEAVCDALSFGQQDRLSAHDVFHLASDTWGHLPVAAAPAWENDLTDDGTPFEFSLGFEGEKPELRLLFESQLGVDRPNQHTSWQAGIALQARLAALGLCDCSQFERVAPLFAPTADYQPRFSLWHATALREQGASLFKAYLNPEIGGLEASRALTAEALNRLQLPHAWAIAEQRITDDTRLPYLSLDLLPAAEARVKLYLTATHADGAEHLLEGAANFTPGRASRWLEQLTQSQGPYSARPILICYAFRSGKARPEATLHVPIRNYSANDEEALARTLELLPAENAKQLVHAVRALARAPLERSHGLLTYVSLRTVDGGVRVTTYLAPGAYAGTDGGERGSGTMPTGRPSARP